VDRHNEALRADYNTVTNTELKQLMTSGIVSKAIRLANLVGLEEILTLLNYERAGVLGDGAAKEWVERTDGRERRRYQHPCHSAGNHFQ
jgi:hypothetical protein